MFSFMQILNCEWASCINWFVLTEREGQVMSMQSKVTPNVSTGHRYTATVAVIEYTHSIQTDSNTGRTTRWGSLRNKIMELVQFLTHWLPCLESKTPEILNKIRVELGITREVNFDPESYNQASFTLKSNITSAARDLSLLECDAV